MSLKKLKIGWSDMFPCILDEEVLFIDDEQKPKIGDVTFYKSPSGEIYFHRLIHKFLGYYFTWGDNKKCIDIPWKSKNYRGICIGKFENIKIKLSMKILLNLSLLFSISFNLNKKIRKNIIKYISFVYSLDQTFWYLNKYDNNLVNESIYNLSKKEIPKNYEEINLRYASRKCIDNRIILSSWFFKNLNKKVFEQKIKNKNILSSEFEKIKIELKNNNIIYSPFKGLTYEHQRDMGDIDLITDNPEKIEKMLSSLGYLIKNNNKMEIEMNKIIDNFHISFDIHRIFPSVCYNFEFPLKKKLTIDSTDKLLICCTHTYQQAYINLRDILDLNHLLEKIDLAKIKLENNGLYEILGGPLILTYLFDKKYNNTKNKQLEIFIKKNYSKELPIFENYMNKRNWEMPIWLLHLYNETKVFYLYKFLKEPREYPYEDLFIKKILHRLIVKIKAHKIRKYCLLKKS